MQLRKTDLLDGLVGLALAILCLPIVLAIKYAPDAWFRPATELLGPDKFLWVAGAFVVAVVVPLTLLVRRLIFGLFGANTRDRP